MTRPQRSLLLSVMLTALLGGCSESPAINRVGVNVVEKSLFEGSWYYSRTVIDVDYEAAGLGTYPGDSAVDFAGGDLGAMPRVRWVIDEDTLYAFRDYELYEGINPEGEGETGDIITHPVAAYGIDAHFDIRRDYSPSTGEETNVIVENTDKVWYERQYMRVDWSENQLPGYYGQTANLYEVLGLYNREPAPLFVQGESNFPDSWQPRFDFMGCDGLTDELDEECSEGERDYANDYPVNQLYHMSFVTQEILSPGTIQDPYYGTVNFCQSIYSDAPNCLSTAIYIRNSFLRVSDTRQYVAQNWTDTRFGRHGYFRLERPTYDRSSAADDPSLGATDFLNYSANRQNIWHDWVDADGNAVPYAERRVRPIVWYTTPELPGHLVEPTYDLVSRWNEVYMRLVRNLRGEDVAVYPRMDCQTDNPDGYCHCTEDPETGAILNPTCPGVYDPFETPDEAIARGVENPWQCYVDVPADAVPDLDDPALSDEDFYGWFSANMVGDECVVEVRMNTCNRATIAANGETTDGMECEERGDARYKFLSYVNQPGTRFLGVATLRGDPVTGEIITGDANIGGPALDGYRTSALRTIDAVTGELTDRDFIIGEDVRDYLANLNNVQQPARPRVDFSVASEVGSAWPGREEAERVLDAQMGAFADRAARLEGPEGRFQTYSDRIESLVGTPLERQLFANEDTLSRAGVQWLPEGFGSDDIDDSILDMVSPFRNSPQDLLDSVNEVDTRYGMNNVLLPNDYTDASVMEFAERHADWPRARLEFALNQLLFYQTQLHEMGHCLGLRHQFGASADTENYDDDYYYIANNIPYPDPADYDMDSVPGLSAVEQAAFERDYDEAKERRELAGIDRWMNSSIMEYTGQWYERTVTGARGAGRYDHAAVSFGYGDLVEIYDNVDGTALTDIDPTNTERAWVKYYQGGETCAVDNDCPFAAGGQNAGLLLQGNIDAGLTQTCQPHPNGASLGNVCSNFDEDAAALITGGETNPRYAPVEYRFCTDDRVGTIGWCHRFDEGDSYREIVRNAAEHYDRNYIFDAFRRYRRNFGVSSYYGRFGRIATNLMAVFGNLVYQYETDPDYRDTEGAFGFTDHFLAAADILNFYGRVLAQPQVGAFTWQDGEGIYVNTSDTPSSTVGDSANLNMPVGLGRYSSSEYQRGLTGINRIEVVGSFYDKIWSMQFMAFRGFATGGYGRDLPYWTNMYDIFPVEMQQIFQAMILGEPEGISARVRCGDTQPFPRCADPEILYMDFYRGDCSDAGVAAGNCRPSSTERYDDGSTYIIDNGIGTYYSLFATVYSLAFIPVYWDTTFQNQVYICIEGAGDCFDVAPSEVEGVDYVRYTSDRYGKTFVARAIEPGVDLPNQESLGFQMIDDAVASRHLLEILQRYRGDEGGTLFSAANLTVDDTAYLTSIAYTIPTANRDVTDEIDRLDARVRRREAYFFQLVDLQRRYGISSYLWF